MTAEWKHGRDMRTLQMQLTKHVEGLKAKSIEALSLSVEEGASKTQDFLESAVTPTGLARAAGRPMVFDGERHSDGGFPGRHDTGNMVGSVSHEIRDARSKVVWGVFGWWGANYEAYFRDQDLGEGNIPAARALPQATIVAETAFHRRMTDVINGREVS